MYMYMNSIHLMTIAEDYSTARELLSLHTITVLPLTTVYIVSEVLCTSDVLHVQYYTVMRTHYYYAITYKFKGNSHITMITVQSSTTCKCIYMYM